MKINRKDLKAIVKECLVELLQEGLGGSATTYVTEGRAGAHRNRDLEPIPGRTQRAHPATSDPAAVRRRTMDLIDHGHRPLPSPVIHEAQQQRQQHVSQIIANASPNPLMAAIFADTANTTFAAQEGSSANVAGDMATKAAASSDPMSLFGEDKIDAWNRAAFAPAMPGLLNSPLAHNLIKGG
jgi:hypothetical protein